jgi:hypothetical protein
MAQELDTGGIPVEGASAALAAALAAATVYSGAKLHLYQSSFSPTKQNVAADYLAAECNFTGYTAATLMYSSIGVDADGNPTALSNRAFFQATDAVSPNNVGGCWVQEDVTGPPATHTAIRWFPFQAPIPMNTALAFIGIVLGLQDPATPGYAIVDH